MQRSQDQTGIELIAPHKRNREKPKTQDGRKLRRYKRRWKVERLFAWLHNFRRLPIRYEYHAENFLGMVQLGCVIILLRLFWDGFYLCKGLTRWQLWWTRYVQVDMIFTHMATQNLDIACFTSLTDQFPRAQRNFTLQNIVPIFCCPNQMILNVANCMGPFLYSLLMVHLHELL